MWKLRVRLVQLHLQLSKLYTPDVYQTRKKIPPEHLTFYHYNSWRLSV
jgi:hypothetical protein